MNSALMKIIAGIYAVVGVIGSIVLASKMDDVMPLTDIPSAIVAIAGIISTAFGAVILFAIAKILEHAEQNNYLLNKMYQEKSREYAKQNAPAGANNSKLNLSAIASANTSDGWRCPKCGKTNPTSSRVCKDCGYEK